MLRLLLIRGSWSLVVVLRDRGHLELLFDEGVVTGACRLVGLCTGHERREFRTSNVTRRNFVFAKTKRFRIWPWGTWLLFGWKLTGCRFCNCRLCNHRFLLLLLLLFWNRAAIFFDRYCWRVPTKRFGSCWLFGSWDHRIDLTLLAVFMMTMALWAVVSVVMMMMFFGLFSWLFPTSSFLWLLLLIFSTQSQQNKNQTTEQ